MIKSNWCKVQSKVDLMAISVLTSVVINIHNNTCISHFLGVKFIEYSYGNEFWNNYDWRIFNYFQWWSCIICHTSMQDFRHPACYKFRVLFLLLPSTPILHSRSYLMPRVYLIATLCYMVMYGHSTIINTVKYQLAKLAVNL